MKIEYVKIEDLKPYKLNAKKHPQKQIEGLAESIRRFGFTQPICIDKKNEVIIGHGRLEAAKLATLDEVPCLRMESLSAKDVRALRLIDNRIAETGWDKELLALDLKGFEYNFEPFNVEFGQFMTDEPKDGNTDPNAVPPVPEKPKTKLGEVYQLGEHRLMCGDSTSVVDVQTLMGGGVADIVFTDPHYNIDYDFSTNGMVETGQRTARFGKIKNDAMSDDDFLEFVRAVFKNLMDNMKDGAPYYISAGRESTQVFNQILKEQEFHIQSWLIWAKENFNISRLDYHPKHEVITYGWKKGKAHPWYSDRSQVDVLNFAREKAGTAVHPTQKPVGLLEYLMGNSSKKEDVVLDLFGGSGSTLMASERIGRRCMTMELDTAYCDVIIKRWQDYTGKTATRL